MAKLCYVVHRYPPYPGGSEYYVQAMAEESLRRGHDVTVFSGEHEGDLNGVKVTSDVEIFRTRFDLVIVHGADVGIQNWVLAHCINHGTIWGSPILYMIILPTDSATGQLAMQKAQYIAWSTQEDWKHIQKYGVQNKAIYVRHGLPSSISDTFSIKDNGFRKEYGIETPYMFISAGGYWPNKGMHELVEVFNESQRKDVTLVLTGYANFQQAPKETEFVKPFIVEDRRDVMRGIAAADLYIMNSTQEGFGLVLLEAMLNKTPWIARKIAGAVELQQYGMTYTHREELRHGLQFFNRGITPDPLKLEIGASYVIENRLIKHTVNDIESVLKK